MQPAVSLLAVLLLIVCIASGVSDSSRDRKPNAGARRALQNELPATYFGLRNENGWDETVRVQPPSDVQLCHSLIHRNTRLRHLVREFVVGPLECTFRR